MMGNERGYTQLIGFQKVVDHFGCWPTFHDAEVLSLTLDRDSQVGETGPTLTIAVHGFEITNEVTPAGYLKTEKHCVTTISFYDVYLQQLEDFNHQNAILGLAIADIAGHQLEHLRLEVAITGANGLSCHFKCRSGQVTELVAGIPAGSMYAGR